MIPDASRQADDDLVKQTDEALARFWDGDPGALRALLDRDGEGAASDPLGATMAVWMAGRSGALPPGATLGEFVLGSEVGRGGMAVVYEAEQRSPRRRVAIKVLRAGHALDGRGVHLFRREIDTLARLTHPSIAAVYGAGCSECGLWYLAMELVRGQPLSEWLAAAPPLARRLTLFAEICDAIAYAHTQDVIHRDIKPSNIFVDDSGRARVLDFGLARFSGADAASASLRTQSGQIVGTLPYMSPEQVLGNASVIDERTDIYALGVLLYQMLSGRLPFDVGTRSIPEAARIICDEEPSRLGLLDPSLRGDLSAIVAKAMEKDRSRRYASAADLADDVRRHLERRPIVARPPSALYTWSRFARRNRTLVAGVAATFAALVAGLVGTVWQAVAATKARDEARRQAEVADFRSYVASIGAAQAALASHDTEAARSHLERAPLRWRGFEWWEARARLDGSTRTFGGNVSGAALLAVDPATGMVAGLTAMGWITVHERSGRLLRGLSCATPNVPYHAVGLAWDGARLVATSQSGLISVVDPESSSVRHIHLDCAVFSAALVAPGQLRTVEAGDRVCIREIDSGQRLGSVSIPGAATGIQSGDGRLLALPIEASVAVWDAASGVQQCVVPDRWARSAQGFWAAFSQDGAILAVVGEDQNIRVWSVEPTPRVVRIVRDVPPQIGPIALLGRGPMLAVADDRVIRLWDLTTDPPRADVLRGHAWSITGLMATATGDLFSGSDDRRIKMWQVAAADGGRRPRTALINSPPGGPVWAMEAAQSDLPPSIVALGGSRADVSRRIRLPEEARRLRPDSPALTADARFMAFRTESPVVTVIDIASARSVCSIELRAPEEFTVCRFSPGGDWLSVCEWETSARIYSTRTWEQVADLSVPSGQAPLAWSPDGSALAYGVASGVNVAGVSDWRVHRTIENTAVEAMGFSSDSACLAAGGQDRRVCLWRIETGERLWRSDPHAAAVCSLAFAPDGRRLAASDYAGKVTLYETAEGRAVATYDAGTTVSRLHFGADPTLLAGYVRGSGECIVWSAGSTGWRLARERLDELLLPSRVAASLESDRGLAPDVRAQALAATADSLGFDSQALNDAAWEIAAISGAPHADYARALRLAEAAVEDEPRAGLYLNTLGVALCRAGDWDRALAVLTRSDEVNGGIPADLAFIVICHANMGRLHEARHAMSRLEAVYGPGKAWGAGTSAGHFAEAKAALRAAEARLEGAPHP